MASFRSLFPEQSGATALIFGLLVVPIIAALGLTVDLARAQSVKASLQSSLDAATLAGVKLSNRSTTERNEAIQGYFNDNWTGSQRMGASLINPNLEIISGAGGALTVRASATVPNVFMRYFGLQNQQVAAESEAMEASSYLELALSLDVSGSMSGTKIQTLRDASKGLVQALQPASSSEAVFVSVVPWDDNTLISTSYTSWLDATVYSTPTQTSSGTYPSSTYISSCGTNATSWRVITQPWLGEVYMRDTPYDVRDDSPATERFTPAQCRRTEYIRNGSVVCARNSGTCSVNTSKRILPLTNNLTTLTSKLDSLQALDYTNGAVGAFWAWMTLSPNWRNTWAGVPAAYPRDYREQNRVKAMVLMTDGMNNNYEAFPSGSGNQTTFVNGKLSSICTAMKNNGIRIFTVAFNLNSLSAPDRTTVETLLRGCATSTDDYFSAPDAASLITAFDDIAGTLNTLRISR